ncbi:MAG TPA: hypothetical protein VNH18_33220 [Bryobacteraceae bacterium]|nr:hypothetical protein [Bryobacteraceae bacterium]
MNRPGRKIKPSVVGRAPVAPGVTLQEPGLRAFLISLATAASTPLASDLDTLVFGVSPTDLC